MIWPNGTTRNQRGELVVGGVSVVELAVEFGTPLYVLDETSIRESARAFRAAFTTAYPGPVRVVYAGKALLNREIARIVTGEGLGLDVVSSGELFVGLQAGVDPASITLHGNNKSRDELAFALDAGVGKIIIDNTYEISLLAELTAGRDVPQPVLIRVNPGVDVHTHHKISTGIADSKFGLPMADGQAEEAVRLIGECLGLKLVGYHAHIGSQLFERDAHAEAIIDILSFACHMKDGHDVELEHFSPGGGFGIAYTNADHPPAIRDWSALIAGTVVAACVAHGLPLPTLTIEPGRSIIGPAGVAIYTVGVIKRLPGIRTYVSVDGGMADNIRPSLYEAKYTATIANRESTEPTETVSIAGKYCESGDILIQEVDLPNPQPGDLLAIPAAGAYTLAMESNYNLALRPAVVMVKNGESRLIRRRETFEDLLRLET